MLKIIYFMQDIRIYGYKSYLIVNSFHYNKYFHINILNIIILMVLNNKNNEYLLILHFMIFIFK